MCFSLEVISGVPQESALGPLTVSTVVLNYCKGQCWVNYFLKVIVYSYLLLMQKSNFLLYFLQNLKSNMLQSQLLFKSKEITFLLHSLSCRV